jgi:hypothetical protein
MIIMTNIYYLFTFYVIFMQLPYILDPAGKADIDKKFVDLSKENKPKKWPDYPEEFASLLKQKIYKFIFIYGWIFVGFFTIQWPIFVFMFIYSLLISPILRITRDEYYEDKEHDLYLAIHWSSSLLVLCVLIFILINHYHLHIDVLSWINKMIWLRK